MNINFGVNFASTGPHVLVDVDGSTTVLDIDTLLQHDSWIVPVFPDEDEEALLPDFRSVSSLLGRTDGLNLRRRPLRKPHLVVRDLFEILGRVAESAYGGRIGEVVVSVSGYYQQEQRHYLLQCAENAGLRSTHLVDNSTAMVLGHIDELSDGGLLVMNVGFEHCEIALAELKDRKLTTTAYEQCISVGGLALTSALMKSIVFSLDREKSGLIRRNMTAANWLRFFEIVETGKKRLAFLNEHGFILERELTGFDENLAVTYTNADLRNMVRYGYEDLCESVERLIPKAMIRDDDIDSVLVGGSGTRNPYFQELLRQRYGNRLLIADDQAKLRGCAQWARVVSTPTTRLTSAAGQDAPESSSEEALGTLIRGAVEVVDDTVHRRRAREASSMSNAEIHTLVRQTATRLHQKSRVADCTELLKGLEQIVQEFEPKLANVPMTEQAQPTETRSGELPSSYRKKVKRISERIREEFEVANITDAVQQKSVRLERAVNLSHDIEVVARQYGDDTRLEAAVKVHTKCVELMIDRDEWNGSDETTFILCEKWLICGLRTVAENKLTGLRSHIAGHVVDLYLARIRHLVSTNEAEAAKNLRNKFRNHFRDDRSGLARLDQCLAEAAKQSGAVP